MHSVRSLVVFTATTALLFGAMVLPADAAAARSYRNCLALNKVYKHGVGRQGAKDHTSGKPVTNFTVSTKIYNLNNGPRAGAQYDLDRDNDGIACEKR